MTDLKTCLHKFYENLNTLREREARYGGNAPLDLLDQINDHQRAIALTEHAIAGELNEAAWREALKPLLAAIEGRSGEAASSVTIGDIGGSIHSSIIAGRDVFVTLTQAVERKEKEGTVSPAPPWPATLPWHEPYYPLPDSGVGLDHIGCGD